MLKIQDKKVILWPLIYILLMGIANFLSAQVFHVTYGESDYVKTMLPFMVILAAYSSLCFYSQGKQLETNWQPTGNSRIFMLIFVPIVVMALFFIVRNVTFEMSFLIPLLVTFLVGFAEEMMFRRVLFVSLLKQSDLARAVIDSAIIFSLLHSINVLGGLPFGQMLIQLIMTFIAGIFYGLMYYHTKSIALLIVSHWLWDYLVLGGASQKYPLIGIATTVLMLMQLLVVLFFVLKQRKAK